MKEDINALDEIHKGACMGKDAIDIVLDKVEDDNLKNELKKEYEDYDRITKQIEDIYPNYNEGEPHETSAINKTMTKMQVDMKTFNDNSTSKIAELLIQGVNMGIIEGRKILNKKELNKEELNKEVSDIVDAYVNMQEESLENLKQYL